MFLKLGKGGGEGGVWGKGGRGRKGGTRERGDRRKEEEGDGGIVKDGYEGGGSSKPRNYKFYGNGNFCKGV